MNSVQDYVKFLTSHPGESFSETDLHCNVYCMSSKYSIEKKHKSMLRRALEKGLVQRKMVQRKSHVYEYFVGKPKPSQIPIITRLKEVLPPDVFERIACQRGKFRATTIKSYATLYEAVDKAIVWSSTTEGHDYWYAVAHGKFDKARKMYPTKAAVKKVAKKEPEKLTVTPTQLKAIVKEFPAAKAGLKKLFPGALEDDIVVKISRTDGVAVCINGRTVDSAIQVRNFGNYAKKSFYLKEEFDWNIVEDDSGNKCLVPTPKAKK